jgi:hypothetical protein
VHGLAVVLDAEAALKISHQSPGRQLKQSLV